uniref:ER membrane protein complex subunit 7 beta-sandwich domain-containing protein n=1 Tax=Entomoneis paludosa TaxID=265537 RepID=A0A7S2Y933_9STRA|mmetsp:Transcript_23230/g.48302  ORF Transcript_23230/g.48302 Transcript_23230/m.48302 type:complete len:221 (+) Transcript_23230:49-711(+)
MQPLSFLFYLVALLGLSTAHAEEGATIRGRLLYPDKSPFNVTTKVTLNHGERTTYCQLAHGCTFEIHGVPPGVHQLDIHSTTHHFGQVKLQVSDDPTEDIKSLEYAFPGANKKVISHPLELTAYATFEYFEKRQGFSVWMILKNPMVLMMAFSVGMMFMMPKMMEGLDPEEKAKMKQQMEMQQDPTKMMSSLWEGISGAEPEEAPKLSSSAAAAKKSSKK